MSSSSLDYGSIAAGQHSGQDGDSNDQDDQAEIPRINEDIETRRVARVKKDWRRKSLHLENIIDRKSTRLNSSHITRSRMPSSA